MLRLGWMSATSMGSPTRRLDRPMPGKTILVVEDEAKFRFSMGLVLRQQGYCVLEAGHGIEALAVLAEADRKGQSIDLVITDIKMPYMNGPELLDAMQRKGFFTKVMAMTGYDHSVFATQLQSKGCRTIIDKPFDAEELLREVAAILAEQPVQS